MTNQTITIATDEYKELIGIKAKYELMMKYRKTDKVAVTKATKEDYQKLIKEQGEALYKLNKRIRVKRTEILYLKQEIGRLHNTITKLKQENRALKGDEKK